MKKMFWKKLLGLVLVASLVVGTFRVGSMANAAEGEPTVTKEGNTVTVIRPDGIKIVKSATDPVVTNNGKEATVDISILVANTAKDSEVKGATADVVLAIDSTYSMQSNGKLDKAKAAAKNFVDKLLDDDLKDRVRVGVISFSMNVNSQYTQSLSSDKDTVKKAIDTIDMVRYTNVQAGIKGAEDLLADSTADLKFIVILSDGAANYAYPAAGVESTATTLNDGSSVKLATGFDYSKLQNGEQTIGSKKDGIKVSNYLAAISESYKAKQSATIYAINYANNDNDAAYTMRNVASAGKSYTADTDAINSVYDSIGKDIKDIVTVTGTTLVDEFPTYMTAATVTGTATISEDGKTVT